MCYLWILLAVGWIYFYYFFNVDTIIAATSVAIEMIADTQKSAADKQFIICFATSATVASSYAKQRPMATTPHSKLAKGINTLPLSPDIFTTSVTIFTIHSEQTAIIFYFRQALLP